MVTWMLGFSGGFNILFHWILPAFWLPWQFPLIGFEFSKMPLLMLSLCGATVVHQYLTRRTFRSITLLVLGLICVQLLIRARIEPPPRRQVDSKLTVSSVLERPLQREDVARAEGAVHRHEVTLYGILRLDPQDEKAYDYSISVAASTIELENGQFIRWEKRSFYNRSALKYGQGLRRWLEGRGLKTQESAGQAGGEWTSLAVIPNREYRKWTDAEGIYRGTVEHRK